MERKRTHVLAYLNVDGNSEGSEDPISHQNLWAATAPVDTSFFEHPTVELAKMLLGCVLVHGPTAGAIVETEAYLGLNDLAAHASKGNTERTRVIFGPPGRAYVYFIYGMYECLNVVAEPPGQPGCVLLRALEPLTGLSLMRDRRNWKGPAEGLANGPGKLTRALAITRAQYGEPLDTGKLCIRQWLQKPVFEVGITPRIGIKECADWPLRFVWRGNSSLSRKEPVQRSTVPQTDRLKPNTQ